MFAKIAKKAAAFLTASGDVSPKAMRVQRIQSNKQHKNKQQKTNFADDDTGAYIAALDDAGIVDPYVYE